MFKFHYCVFFLILSSVFVSCDQGGSDKEEIFTPQIQATITRSRLDPTKAHVQDVVLYWVSSYTNTTSDGIYGAQVQVDNIICTPTGSLQNVYVSSEEMVTSVGKTHTLTVVIDGITYISKLSMPGEFAPVCLSTCTQSDPLPITYSFSDNLPSDMVSVLAYGSGTTSGENYNEEFVPAISGEYKFPVGTFSVGNNHFIDMLMSSKSTIPGATTDSYFCVTQIHQWTVDITN